MPHPNPRILVPIAVIAVLGLGGWYIEAQRAKQRSRLSGFFETQPIELASRVGGRTLRIMVREGDRVTAGQPIITFEAEAVKAQAQAREAQAQQARHQLLEVEKGPRIEDIKRQQAVV